jgi:putative hydrolase of the HAD superfamily
VLLGDLWYSPIADLAQLSPDVIPTLRALRDADVKLALVANTTWQGEVIDHHLQEIGVLDFFPVRIYSTEHGSRKPHPALYHDALRELNVPPEDAAFVGDDAATDLLGARRLHMKTVLRSAEPSKRARKLADHVIERIGQLIEIFELAPPPSSPPTIEFGQPLESPLKIPSLNQMS